jgi:hypothetical protein
MGCAPSQPHHAGAGAPALLASSGEQQALPAELRNDEYCMSMLLTPRLRGPLEEFLASSPKLAGAAAGAAFVAALERAQADLEQGILSPRRVAAQDSVAGPFDDHSGESVWGLVEDTLRKFQGHHQPAALELRSVEASVLAAENEVRLMGNAYTVETVGGEDKWVRACPIDPREAFEHIRNARRTAVRLLAAYALPQFARSPWGVEQSAALRQSGYHEPADLHSAAPPRLCAGDRLSDILDALARPPPPPAPLPGSNGGFEADSAARRAAWLEKFKVLIDSLPHMVSIGDMRTYGAWEGWWGGRGAALRWAAMGLGDRATLPLTHTHTLSCTTAPAQARPLFTSTRPFAAPLATPCRRWPACAATRAFCRGR